MASRYALQDPSRQLVCCWSSWILTWSMAEFCDELNAGDSIYFNPTYPHGQRCNGDVPCKFITIIAE